MTLATRPRPGLPNTATGAVMDALLTAGHATAVELSALTGVKAATISSFLNKRHIRGELCRRQEGPAFRYWLNGEPTPPEPKSTPEIEPAPFVPFRPYVGHQFEAAAPASLANETVVLLAIAREPGSTTFEVSEATGLTVADLAAALRILQQCDAVVGERVGRETCWRVSG